ncbi:type II restriction endonuclease [Pseudomonas sp. AN3A02]|uniref:type II restriction endonuclease n=1 Tax=Pseudomonas sp. AN3A02 TaxID=2719587 RepID=UPI001430A1C5|nr:type II restriction endonuclease [Pseudomonas sp. AN3A02]NIL17287.1 type II restriction endonuclease [Pseudomonas sp. AN3A02]
MNGAVLLEPACLKTLSLVECTPSASNQHEFNGVAQLKSFLGVERKTLESVFTIRGTGTRAVVNVTWYDARENDDSRSAEFRLYFQTNAVMSSANQGDNMMIGLDRNGVLNLILLK